MNKWVDQEYKRPVMDAEKAMECFKKLKPFLWSYGTVFRWFAQEPPIIHPSPFMRACGNYNIKSPKQITFTQFVKHYQIILKEC